MAEFPALPLWTDAYLADTSHLSEAEHGRYLLILMLIWRSPRCRIPNDEIWIAKRLRRSVDDYRAEVKPLIDEFCATDGNWITQKRLRKEWDRCVGRRQKASDGANALKNKRTNYRSSSATISNTISNTNLASSYDFVSDDGKTIVREEQIAAWEEAYPSVKNIRGRLRHGFRTWLQTIADDERVGAFERHLSNEQRKAEKAPIDPKTGKKYRTYGEFGRRPLADRIADGTWIGFKKNGH